MPTPSESTALPPCLVRRPGSLRGVTYRAQIPSSLQTMSITSPSVEELRRFLPVSEALRWRHSSLEKLIISTIVTSLPIPTVMMDHPTSVLRNVGPVSIHWQWLGNSPMRNSWISSSLWSTTENSVSDGGRQVTQVSVVMHGEHP